MNGTARVHTRPHPRPHGRVAWLRVLVLLLALLVPGEACAVAALPASVPTAAATAEHDVTDTAVRLPGQGTQRAAVPPRPARVPGAPVPQRPGGAGEQAASPAPYTALCALRSVVLRC
ncbi:hypothetical protein [Streptomyces sp. NPDC003299]